MAYDKVIDSSALDANLASIAEAIRTKGGTTDQLVFPAGFISAIEAISAGSSFSLPSKITNFAVDSVAISYGRTDAKLSHSLGVVPTAAILIAQNARNPGAGTSYHEVEISYGKANYFLQFSAPTDQFADGKVEYANLSISTYKKNTTYDHTENYVNFVGGTFYGREYILITMRWEE